jgi:hypothetical protein
MLKLKIYIFKLIFTLSDNKLVAVSVKIERNFLNDTLNLIKVK